ncbi:MAG: phosphotransferase [Gemmatimonadaceae bacterium]
MSASEVSKYFSHEQFGSVLEAKPLSMGMSGASVYDVTTERGSYVLRVAGPHTQDWQRQMAVLRLVSDNAIAPRILFMDAAERATITEKVPGTGLIGAMSDPNTRGPAIMSLVDTVAKMHAIPASDIVATDPLIVVRQLWNVQSVRPGFPEWANKIGKTFGAIEAVLSTDERRVLSHNDLNPGNVLWDGTRAWLIDFEASARIHPYYDLAGFTLFLSLPLESALGLLAKQEGSAITQEQAVVFECLRRVAAALYGMIFLSLVPDLQTVPVTALEETGTLSDCYARHSSGQVPLQSAVGQGAMGKAFLKLAMT